MFDVIHYLMEEDVIPGSREHHAARTKFRGTIYPDFYGREYSLAGGDKQASNQEDQWPDQPPMDASGSHPQPIPQPAAASASAAQIAPRPVPQPVPSHGNMAPDSGGGHPVRPLTPGGRQMRAVSEGRGMKHKPYIPPTDGNMVNDPFHPFQNLRETPLF